MIDYKAEVVKPKYKFLYEDPRIDNLVILGLGGSHAYGTNVEGSDLDIRGVALNSKREILLGQDFEQVVNETTDTTVYSFKKIYFSHIYVVSYGFRSYSIHSLSTSFHL